MNARRGHKSASWAAWGACAWLWCVPALAQELEPLGGPDPEPLGPGRERGFTPDRPKTLSGAGDPFWLDLSAGMSFVKRSYTLESLEAGLALDSSFYSTVHVDGALYPLAPWFRGELPENIGLLLGFARGSDVTIVEEAELTRRIPTRHSEFTAGLGLRWPVLPDLWVRGEGGLHILDFVLGDNPFYSSTTYRAWWVGASAEYALLDGVRLDAGFDFIPTANLGVSEQEFGQSSKTLGAIVDLGAEVDLVGYLYLHGGYRLRWLSTSFQGSGNRGLEAVVTADIFHDLALWVGYRL